MSSTKCGSLILDAIDQLRKRKARPDLDRICYTLERRHGVKAPFVNEALTKLVNEGTVIKVDYKGNTSYRNAAKWVKTKTHFYGSFYTANDISSHVLEAVRALTIPAKDQPMRSVSIQEIEQYLLKKDSQSNLNHATLRTVLEKEVEKHNLHQLSNGEFVPHVLKPNYNSSKFPIVKSTCGSGPNSPPKTLYAASGSNSQDKVCSRSPSSSDEMNKKIKRDSDSSYQDFFMDVPSPTLSRCDYCLFTANANRKGEYEELLTCRDCGAKAHPSCMEYTKLLYERYPDSQNWQCPDCKICNICEDSTGSTDMLTCYICFNGFHMSCHDPPLTTKPEGAWLCYKCDVNDDKSKIQKIRQKMSSEFRFDVTNPMKEEFFKSLEQYPSSVPLAKMWSIENVEYFLKYLGFEDEAAAFKEQEIDGISLLLMKRSDVLTGLGIKLGPAVKIYKHIVKLQARVSSN